MNKKKTSLLKLVSIVIMTFFSTSIMAINVTIDPGDYTGQHHTTMYGYAHGIKTYDFTPSVQHTINFADQPMGFHFIVNPDGSITSDSTNIEITGSIIKFKTKAITIDPGLFIMTYNINGRYYYRATQIVYNLMVKGTGSMDYGNQYQLGLGDQPNGFNFRVDENGNIETNSSRFHIENNNTIKFTTIPVTIDPERYIGNYLVVGGYYLHGIRELNLVPTGTGSDDFGSSIVINIGNQTNRIHFELTPDGTIISDSSRITISGNSVTFKTVLIEINPGDFLQKYGVTGNIRYIHGIQQVYHLAEGTGSMDYLNRYELKLGEQYNGLIFSIDQNGNVIADSSRFTISGNTISFNKTFPITITPENPTLRYNIFSPYHYTGEQTLSLVPTGTGSSDHGSNIKLYLPDTNEYAIFNIEDPCAVLPSENIIAGGEKFSVTCPNEIIDLDADGIADTADNCIDIPNVDQIDQDNDGLGDVCDNDLDGDTIDNTSDNCPAFANTDQSDLDGDNIGDVCDDDDDGDSVPSLEDNCPLMPNVGQEDNDLDGMGDVCDIDDDNDEILDTSDNCKIIPNPDQVDSDADGLGDECDTDIDGDGVLNADDSCEGTPSSVGTTSDGCSGHQYVELQCKKSDFSTHGHYVKCVADTSKGMQEQNLLTNKERSRLIREAAKK